MTTKNKVQRYVTPVGEANYPYLVTPDTQFNPDGDYKVNLVFTPEEYKKVKPLVDKLEVIQDEALVEFQQQSKKKLTKADIVEELEDGSFQLKFKQKAKIKKKDGEVIEVKLALFDSKGTPIMDKPNIGRGSKIKVSFTVAPYMLPATKQVGLSLRPCAVQIIELVEFSGSQSGEAYGFEAEEGYEYHKEESGSEEFFDSPAQGMSPEDDTEIESQESTKGGDF